MNSTISRSLSRRAFLAGAGAAALRQPLAGAGWNMRLSTSSVMFNSLPVEQACARIAGLGFEAVDFWQGEAFKCTHLDEIATRLGADGLQRLLAKHRVEISAFTCYLGIPIEPYAEILGKAGRGNGVLVRESQYLRTADGRPAPAPKDISDLTARMRGLRENLKHQLDLAEQHGFRLAIENHSGAILNSLDSFKAFLDVSDHPRLGIAIAPYHLQRAGVAVEDAIELSGDRLFFFYAWQNEPGMKQLPGFGPADFTPWLRALAKAGYRDYVNPFMHGPLGKQKTEAEPEPEKMAKALARSRQYLIRSQQRLNGM